MATTFNITLYLFSCFCSIIQASSGEYCSYYDNSFRKTLFRKSCPYGCCNVGIDATDNNVCCEYDEFRSGDYNRNLTNTIIGIAVGVVACVISIVVVIVIIACCCCKRQPPTQGHVIAAPNPTVVYSNSTSTVHPGAVYPPQGTNNSALPPTGYSDPPPSYDAVTSPGQDNKGFQTHVNMN